MNKELLIKNLASLFIIFLMVMIPMQSAKALSFINEPSVAETTHNSATIKWDSDESTKGTIHYGTGLINEQKSEPQAVISHTIMLTDLQPSTTYNFYAKMLKDAEEVGKPDDWNTGGYYSFTTNAPPDTQAPHAPIELTAVETEQENVYVEWGKHAEDNDIDSYNVSLNGKELANTKTRSWTFSGLEPETEYSLGVSAIDFAGNKGPEATLSVTTLSKNIRDILISPLKIELLGTDVTLRWSTDYPTNALISYGTDSVVLSSSDTFADYLESREVNITGLDENTKYYFQVIACDQYQNCANATSEVKTAEIVEPFLEITQPAFNQSTDETYWHNSYELDIKGRTAPFSDVSAYVNGNRVRFKRMYEQSEFLFSRISLSQSEEENEIRIVSEPRQGDSIEVLKKVKVDRLAPDLKNVTIDSFTSDGGVTVKGNITEDGETTVNMYVQQQSYAFHISQDDNEGFPDYYRQQGDQTRLTEEVKQAAELIEIDNESTSAQAVEKIIGWAGENLGPGNCEGDVRTRERPAKAIISSRCAPEGTDIAVGMIALAKAKGIPARYIETIDPEWAHCIDLYGIDAKPCEESKTKAYVEFYLEDEQKWIVLDPEDRSTPQKTAEGYFLTGAYGEGEYLVLGYGKDAWELGLNREDAVKKEVESAIAKGYSSEKMKVLVDSSTIYQSGEFSVTLTGLQEGTSEVIIEFSDIARNTKEFQQIITYDSTPPSFITPTSLDPYSPSYVYKIKISGQVDDVSTVYAFVNEGNTDNLDKAQASVLTDGEGNFNVPVELALIGGRGTVSENGTSAEASGEIGAGVVSHVVLIAVDEAGQKSEPLEGEIAFGQCSDGFQWKIDVTDVSPSRLNARELLEGLAGFGFGFNLSWQGGGSEEYAQVTAVRLRSAPLGSAYENSQYDKAEDYVSFSAPDLDTDKKRGVVIGTFKPMIVEGNTTYEMEKEIASHGKDGMCTLPGVGCFKFLLTLEVNYVYSEPGTTQYGTAQQQAGVPQQTIQKHCFPVEIIIDERPDPSMIPNSFLRASVDFIDHLIDAIELVLEPLKKVTMFVLIGCLAMWVSQFVVSIKKQMSCKWGAALSKEGIVEILKSIAGRNQFENSAEQGLCDVTYTGDDNENIRSACNDCSNSIATFNKVTFAQHFLCDRIICPAIPTFQEYIKQNKGGSSKIGFALDVHTSTHYIGNGNIEKFFNINEIDGNDAGPSKGELTTQLSIDNDCELVDSRGAKTVYKLWEAYDNNKAQLSSDCTKPHPYQAQCCAASYMREWDWAGVFLDPLEQSMCLANPQAEECSFGERLVNGIVGICEPDNKQSTVQTIDGFKYTRDFIEDTRSDANGHVVYLIVYGEDGTKLQSVTRGYVSQRWTDIRESSSVSAGFTPLVGDTGFVPDSLNLANSFDEASMAEPDKQKEAPPYKNTEFYKDITKAIDAGKLGLRQFGTNNMNKEELIKAAYDRVASEAGTTDQKYVLQPQGSFVQSLIALCLGGITAYLSMALRILRQLKMCFQSILYTGDGSAGQCEAIISQYICDLIIEAISCLMRKYASGGPSGQGGGLGSFLGAMHDANSDVMGDITSRYGDQNLFTQQFSTASLAKGACIFAFTGEWPVSFGALLNSATTIPVQSFATVYPAERRFQAYKADGTAIFTYHIGTSFFAGAPSNVHLELICSGSDLTCPENGRELDKCDCAEIGEQKMVVSLSAANCKPACKDSYPQDGVCDTECFIKVDGFDYRFDRARFVWDYTGGQTSSGLGGPITQLSSPNPEALSGSEEHTINEFGGPPMGVCDFDATELKYRCGFAGAGDMYGRLADVKLATPLGQDTIDPVFQIGDGHIFDIDAVMKTPEGILDECDMGDCEATKYLSVVIRNQNGRIVYPEDYSETSKVSPTSHSTTTLPPAERLNGNQRYQLAFWDSLDFEGLPSFEITSEMFEMPPSSTSSSGATGSGCYKSATEAADFGILCTQDSVPQSLVGQFDKGYKFAVSGGKIFIQNCDRTGDVCAIKGDKTECSLTGVQLKCGGQKFTYQGDANLQALEGKTSIIYFGQETRPGVASQKQGFQCVPLKAYPWTATISLYNAQKDGTTWRMSPQIATTPDGKLQTETIPFNVYCSKARDDTKKSKLSGLSYSTAEFTPDLNSDYGITVTEIDAGERVKVADYNTNEDKTMFELNILVDAIVSDIEIDVGSEGFSTENVNVKDIRTDKNVPTCAKDPTTGWQPRNCFRTEDGKVYLHMKASNVKYQFIFPESASDVTGEERETVTVAEETEAKSGTANSVTKTFEGECIEGCEGKVSAYYDSSSGDTLWKDESGAKITGKVKSTFHKDPSLIGNCYDIENGLSQGKTDC